MIGWMLLEGLSKVSVQVASKAWAMHLGIWHVMTYKLIWNSWKKPLAKSSGLKESWKGSKKCMKALQLRDDTCGWMLTGNNLRRIPNP